MDDEDYNLSQLLLNAASPSTFLTSPTQPRDSEALPIVQQRQISKRRGKKRSLRACGACRARKVRCNIVAHGAPCSNCRHDEVDCVLPLSRRQKSSRERIEKEQRETSIRGSVFNAGVEGGCIESVELDSNPKVHSQQPSITQRSWSSQFERAHLIAKTSQLAPHAMAISEHPLAKILPTSAIKSSSADISPPGTSFRTKPWIQISSPLASAPTTRTASSQLSILPSIFTPFPRHLDTHDLTYLNSRDALALPSELLQIELLKAYTEFVHPTFPVLDFEDFLSVVKYGSHRLESKKGNEVERDSSVKTQIPFLLFQAVMFAAIDFVSMEVLTKAGHRTRDSAKRAFFARVRLLYDFDTTTDRLSIIQSLLLMTLSPPTSHDLRDSWHWLGLAISLSLSLGLNQARLQMNTNLRRKHLERRIWWTMWAKQMRIKREDCDIEMLSLEDFDLDSGVDEEADFDEVWRAKRNAETCLNQARLCWCCDERLASNVSAVWNPRLPRPLPLQLLVNLQQPEMQLNTEYAHSSLASYFENPAFNSQKELERHIAPSSSSSSAIDDCVTPREHDDIRFRAEDHKQTDNFVCSSPLGVGCGVDGEYDDYLEFLRDPVIPKKR